jgi:hypothetical protein
MIQGTIHGDGKFEDVLTIDIVLLLQLFIRAKGAPTF